MSTNKKEEDTEGLVPENTAALNWFNFRSPEELMVFSEKYDLFCTIKDIWMQEVILPWWNSPGIDKHDKTGDYFPMELHEHLSHDQIASIYLKEHTVKEEGNFIEKSQAKGIITSNDMLQDAIDRGVLCESIKERNTPVEEILEYAAATECSEEEGKCALDRARAKINFLKGASWKKENDKIFIQELIDYLIVFEDTMNKIEHDNLFRYSLQSAITKAEAFLGTKS